MREGKSNIPPVNAEAAQATLYSHVKVTKFNFKNSKPKPMQIFCTEIAGGRATAKLWWCSPNKAKQHSNRCIPFSEIKTVLLGRSTLVFTRRAAQNAIQDCCFSIAWGNRTLDLQMPTSSLRSHFVFALCRVAQIDNPVPEIVVRPATPPPPREPSVVRVSDQNLSDEEFAKEWYKATMVLALADGFLGMERFKLLKNIRLNLSITDRVHKEVLEELDLSEEALINYSEKEPLEIQECCVCLDRPADHVILDCMHVCVCVDCANVFSEGQDCPRCRQPIQSIRLVK